MNSPNDTDRNLPFLRNVIRHGTFIGLLGQTGAWSLVVGIALLIERPDLPPLLPTGLVGIGLGAVALSFLLVSRANSA